MFWSLRLALRASPGDDHRGLSRDGQGDREEHQHHPPGGRPVEGGGPPGHAFEHRCWGRTPLVLFKLFSRTHWVGVSQNEKYHRNDNIFKYFQRFFARKNVLARNIFFLFWIVASRTRQGIKLADKWVHRLRDKKPDFSLKFHLICSP